jgi:hypothetical protein
MPPAPTCRINSTISRLLNFLRRELVLTAIFIAGSLAFRVKRQGVTEDFF